MSEARGRACKAAKAQSGSASPASLPFLHAPVSCSWACSSAGAWGRGEGEAGSCRDARDQEQTALPARDLLHPSLLGPQAEPELGTERIMMCGGMLAAEEEGAVPGQWEVQGGGEARHCL